MIHKLTRLGSRQTTCCLTVPDIVKLGSSDATWEDGDEVQGAQCADGCWPSPGAAPTRADPCDCQRAHEEKRPSTCQYASSPVALQKFKVTTERRDSKTGKVLSVPAGFAMVNRDGSVSVTLDVLPVDGRLRLVPA